MTEGKWTAQLLRALRQARPNAMVVKLSDRTTAGLPDFFINEAGRTTFAEVKLTSTRRRGGASGNPKIFVPLQLEMCRRLGAWYIVWSPPLRLGWAFRTEAREAWHKERGATFDELVLWIARTF